MKYKEGTLVQFSNPSEYFQKKLGMGLIVDTIKHPQMAPRYSVYWFGLKTFNVHGAKFLIVLSEGR